MLGGDYMVVDIALWGWARMVPYVLGDAEAWDKLPNVKLVRCREPATRSAAGRRTAMRRARRLGCVLSEQAAQLLMNRTAEALACVAIRAAAGQRR